MSGRWARRRATWGSGVLVLEMCWSKRLLVVWRESVRFEDQEWMAGGGEVMSE
jgi:hypothetical protein